MTRCRYSTAMLMCTGGCHDLVRPAPLRLPRLPPRVLAWAV